jgi:UDP-glucose:(heptosyl)LPS alpha-1,3-glucosyltransferase
MKLALVRQKYNPYGGAERFVERALAALAGQQVTLVCREWSGAPNHPVLTCNPFHVGRLWRDWSFARCVQRALARERFDLVQSHERIPGCAIYRAGDGVHATWLELRGRNQSPLARLAARLNPWHRYTLTAEARMFRHAALKAVICNSRMVRDDIAARFAVPEGKLHVIYNGIDLEAFHPRLREQHRSRLRGELGIAETVPLFVYVGSGFERKGVPQLLQAFARMTTRSAQLLVIGRDKRQRQVETAVRRLGLAQRVRFLGGQQDVRPFYGAADAAVLPTLYDPFPNVALETLACGLPLLTSTTCGARELIRQGDNGYVCDALDIPALSGFLDRLAQPGRATAMGQAARSSVSDLSLERMAQQLVGLYRSLLALPRDEMAAPL